MSTFTIYAVHRLVAPTRLPCLAPSPAAALMVGRQAFPGFLVTVAPRGPQPLRSA
jgi:hypothetical protein